MKFLRVLCVLALALCFTASVYAETQSVKVSGDLTVRGIFRNQYDYLGSPNENTFDNIHRDGVDSAASDWFTSAAAIQVDADLTDNVQTVIRVLNQRDWNVANRPDINMGQSLAPNGRGEYLPNQDEFDVMLDLAYVTLKNFIYSPLTVTIGRQDLWFGKGFIVGANQQNPGSALGTANDLVQNARNGTTTPVGNLAAPEYTEINSFDAFKAVLDYDPWTITGIYSKIYEDEVQVNDDVDLWGVNVGYKFDSYKAEAEGYWFYKRDNSISRWGPIKSNNDVHTIGLRGSLDPMDIITLAGEAAYQGGEYVGSRYQINNRNRSAFAIDASGELRYFTDKCSWKPKLGAEYVFYSGNDPESNPAVAAGDYNGWNPMYRGKFDSAIREFVGRFYSTGRYGSHNNNAGGASVVTDGGNHLKSADDASFTNQHQIILLGSVQPIESLTLKANYNLFWNQDAYLVNNDKTQGFIGQEVDLNATWDYTEDVSFGLLAGWFIPGEVYFDNRNDVATDLVGTVKVSF